MSDARDRPDPDPNEERQPGEEIRYSSDYPGVAPLPPESAAPRGGGGWPDLGNFQPGVIPLRPLGLGDILGGALATLRSHAAMLFGAAFVAIGLSQLLALALVWPRIQEVAATAGADELSDEQMVGLMLDRLAVDGVSMGFLMLAQLFVTGLATIVVGKAVLGRTIGFAEAWEDLRPRLIPLLGVTVLVGVIVFAGVMLFLIPGIWAAVVLALAAPALVLERTSVPHAMRRSWDLVLNSWWRIFGILALAFAIGTAIYIVVILPFEIMTGGGVEPGSTVTNEQIILGTVGEVVATTVLYPFVVTVTALVYIDRRIRTEGLALELARAAGMAPPDAGPPGSPHAW
ncbi:hypothetical protein H0B56_05015 [Haloechinothrix sp. YIM 98757]|uniref:DUF7847 domain-containing protein n=1 Tax=Haloechinothrix aidingensis TaxID=2752311 RepID=A0A838A880_9PSEU|nr:hypothetical protein [Haloechinothrix aidingensis]MBA0124897.1 hypothetical protein [Haloechinothrix aidingensis]